jgi:hypothetical protein
MRAAHPGATSTACLTRAPKNRSSTLPSEHSPQDKVPAAQVAGAVDVAAVSPADPRQPGDSEFVAPAILSPVGFRARITGGRVEVGRGC